MSQNNRGNSERGSALLEFGLVAILFLAIFFGIIDFARALYSYHFVANAAREGTRYAIVRGAACNASLPGCRAEITNPSDPTDPVPQYVKGLANGIGIDQSLVSVQASWLGPPPPPPLSSSLVCAPIDSPGCIVQVQVTYAFSFIFPLMPTTTCAVGSPPVTANICMTSTSQMVISQ